jgi:hypothetical protein
MMDVHFDHLHNRAMCREIGERLAAALGPPPQELPPRLRVLLEQLAKVEADSPPPQSYRS